MAKPTGRKLVTKSVAGEIESVMRLTYTMCRDDGYDHESAIVSARQNVIDTFVAERGYALGEVVGAMPELS